MLPRMILGGIKYINVYIRMQTSNRFIIRRFRHVDESHSYLKYTPWCSRLRVFIRVSGIDNSEVVPCLTIIARELL
jgi:hypothetical protein